MSDLTPEEQSVKGTVILSAATALLGVALGAVALAGGAGQWSSFSRECDYSRQAAEVAPANDDTPHTYPYATSGDANFAHASAEVALNESRRERASEHSGHRATARARARVASSTRGAFVARRDFRESLSEDVEAVADVKSDARVKVAAASPEPSRQVRAVWSATRTPMTESARLSAGSPLKCLKEIRPPDASKSALPAGYMVSEMVERREPYVHIAPLLHALDAVASSLTTAHKDEAKKDEETGAGLPVVARPECAGDETLPAGSSETPADAPDGGAPPLPPNMDCKAESPQED